MTSNENIIPGFDDSYDKNLSVTLSTVDAVDHCISVHIKGSLDNYNSVFFQEKLEKIVAAGYLKVIFRCSALDYVSSTGIGVFATFFSKLKDIGGNIVFTDLQPKVEELFQLLGFSHFFHIVANYDDGVKSLGDKTTLIESVFPKSITCPICNVHLKVKYAGKFRCPSCKAIISVDGNGTVSL